MDKQALIEQVEKALDGLRPYLAADGGNVRVTELTDDGKVFVEFLGSCSSCPMSTMTFKAGIEQAVLKAVPEITQVIAINITQPV